MKKAAQYVAANTQKNKELVWDGIRLRKAAGRL